MNGEKDTMSQAAADALQRRLVSFAVKIIEMVGRLPKTSAGGHVSGQILRSGTSPAPNYGEAEDAESRDDFIHKAIRQLALAWDRASAKEDSSLAAEIRGGIERLHAILAKRQNPPGKSG